jgi:UDP-arabinose 4-epimerase
MFAGGLGDVPERPRFRRPADDGKPSVNRTGCGCRSVIGRSILVTGGAGYVGSHAAKALAAAGHLPVVYDNLSTGNPWAARWGPMVQGELSDRARLAKTLREYRIDGVLHFAARALVGESLTDPRAYFETNVTGTLSLLDAMRDCGVGTVVMSSSCAVYGLPVELPISEEHPTTPTSPYGETKLAAERALQWYGSAYGLKWMALRYFNAAGADPDGEIGETHDPETHLIPLAIEAASGRGEALQLFGNDYETRDGTAVRDYVHVSDLAQAHLSALNHLAVGGEGGAFNLGTGRGTSVREVLDSVRRVSGASVPVVETVRRPGDPSELVANAERSKRLLGWMAERSDIDTIVRTAWAWHRLRRR